MFLSSPPPFSIAFSSSPLFFAFVLDKFCLFPCQFFRSVESHLVFSWILLPLPRPPGSFLHLWVRSKAGNSTSTYTRTIS